MDVQEELEQVAEGMIADAGLREREGLTVIVILREGEEGAVVAGGQSGPDEVFGELLYAARAAAEEAGRNFSVIQTGKQGQG